jgi:hypothetical protein
MDMEVAALKRRKDLASVESKGGVRTARGREWRARRCA